MRNIELPAGLLRSTNVEAKAVEHRLSDPTGSRSLASTTSSSSANCSLSVLSHDNGAHLEIAVIESTLMVQDIDKKRQKVWRVLTVFNVIVEDKHHNRSLVRYVPDFLEFDRKVRKHYRKSRIPLPQIFEPDLPVRGSGKRASFRGFLSRISKLRFPKSNCEKIEQYLHKCALHPTIGRSSLFRDFLSKQRPEDQIVPKDVVQSYVHQQIIEAERQKQATPMHRDTVSDRLSSSRMQTDEGEHMASTTSPTNYDEQYSSTSSDLSIVSASVHTGNGIIGGDEGEYEESAAYSEQHEPPAKKRATTIHDYQFLKVLGKGCMGKVLLVRPYQSSRLLALKAISKESVIAQREIEHTKMERDILTTIAKIRHPFLIRLHHAFQDANQLFLVLDYHVGGDMATQLAKSYKLSPERCLLYTAEILLGLQELHRLGILYRDLKPENILLAADGHIVLTDFGLSKQFASADGMDTQKTGTFCGTAEYLAPEILRSEEYTYAVDFWSLGTILYEMLVGITPFWCENHAEMYRRVLEDPLEFPEDFDPVTKDFIASLLQREPTLRLGTGPEGPSRIRSHPYFEGLDWSDVYHKRIRPPYVPHLRSETDVSHFDQDFLRMTPRLSPVMNAEILSQSVQQVFQGYSYINDSSVYTGSFPEQRDYYSDSDIQPSDFHRDGGDEGFSTQEEEHGYVYGRSYIHASSSLSLSSSSDSHYNRKSIY